MVAQALITLQWDRLPDHFDCKPVVLTGLLASMFLFGLSKNLHRYVSCRAPNSNSGITKSMMIDTTDSSNRA
ncbi:uncharacterized protein EDB93DRAFT_1076405 [Suillus bovinus]|uniref:uncharacterized protein n=1 Tax=Suillus bovinus TaxID=48563 RepID=UPI001B869517|nr:uncharacterized protein EDB93DRAFT_1076405 [Suillus bovinus]KAG2158548.1 hypothetical protein EDB93DRAFT_1076405 [Suillus bovinus]